MKDIKIYFSYSKKMKKPKLINYCRQKSDEL